MKKRSEEIAVCPHCGQPMVWTFAFAYSEYLCLNCGCHTGMMEADRKEATPELKYRQKLYDKIWHILYGKGGFLPRSSYKKDGCEKCNTEDHNHHLTEREKMQNEVATQIFQRLIAKQ